MIIKSLLDTDLYKFTMQQTVLHQFPNAHEVEYHFKCRTPGVDLAQYIPEIKDEISHLCSIRFKSDELDYLRSLRFMKPDYCDFLNLFHLQEQYVKVEDIGGGEIDITVKGPWLHTIMFEVPILAIVNEVYFRNTNDPTTHDKLMKEGNARLSEEIEFVKKNATPDFKYFEFGTRRRFSASWQDMVINRLNKEAKPYFSGTSNVLMAKNYNLVCIGTMAHEYLQACQALGPRLRESQNYALEKWVQEYRGDLGIALTDVINIDAFLKDFDLYFCKLFDGVRHDSGDPYVWGEKVLAHYEKMKINALDKSLVFSDGLDMPLAVDLQRTFGTRAKVFAGIGTNLSNDLGPKAINIVMKMTECLGQPVAKISDSPGKSMCRDESFLNYLRSTFDVASEPKAKKSYKMKK